MNADQLGKNGLLLVSLVEAGRHSIAEIERAQQDYLSDGRPSPNIVSFEIKRFRTLEETIGANATRLNSLLTANHLEAPHLVFIAHGVGSAIVKHLLSGAMKQAVESKTNASTDDDELDLRDISFRTRKIISIGAAQAYEKPPAFFQKLTGKFGNTARDIDAPARERCVGIEMSLAGRLREYSNWGWPYPQLDELVLQEEMSRETADVEAGFRESYGNYCDLHLVTNLSAWPQDPLRLFEQPSVKTLVNAELNRFIQSFELPLTRNILTTFFDRPDLVTLISDGDEQRGIDDDPIAKKSSGAQQAVFAEIYRQAVGKKSRYHQNFSLIVSGQAGLGKSTLLRRLAQASAFNFFRHPSPRTPAPIFINMPSVSIETVSIGGPAGDDFLARLILDKLLEIVAENFVELSDEKLHMREPVQRALAKQSTILIIDGIDEFLINAPDIRLLHFRMAVEKLLELSREADLRLIIGIRNSVRNFAQLASSPDKVFMLSGLSTEQALRHFGETSQWITGIQQADLREAFLTPLILSAFRESNVRIHASVSTISGLWDLALRSILSKSGISKVADARGRATSIDDWIDALSIVAAAFHMTLRYDFSINELRNQIDLMRIRWKQFSDEHREVASRETDPAGGFELLDNERTLKALIERTVFTVSSQNTVQFNHRQWRDYLTGRYTATCLELGNVDEIGGMAFNVQIYRTAGELLSPQAIDEELISRAIQRTIDTQNEFVIGNLGALIGNAPAPMTRPAIMRLFQRMSDYTPLIQTVIVGSVARRGLETTDKSSIDIRKGIDPTLRMFAASSEDSHCNRLLASLSWCFLRAYHNRFNASAPPKEFTPFTFDSGSDDARAVVCVKKDGLWTYDNKFASVQDTFATIQETVLADPVTRPISVVHYLACIVAARTAGAQIPEVTEELSLVLEPGSDFEAAFRDFSDVPEVYDLYRRCQAEHQRYGGG